MAHQDPRVDAYIDRAAAFAQPILRHFRRLVHATSRDFQETMKWSMPFFVKNGQNVCHMAAFKAHCAVGFWHPDVRKKIEANHGATDNAMGLFGRLQSLTDLPSDRTLADYVRAGAALADTGAPARPGRRRKRPEAAVPPDLASNLRKDRAARATFEKFAPSHRREYIEWITEAKRPETRAKRIATTIAWLREGKTRQWKYQRS